MVSSKTLTVIYIISQPFFHRKTADLSTRHDEKTTFPIIVFSPQYDRAMPQLANPNGRKLANANG
jgi:hypothetical protein